eukprot:c23534_g2_i2 orf=154-537(-)
MSKATILRNDTDETLFLRDKIGASYGGTRYKILARSQIKVSPLQHTFFKMIAYAVEEGGSVEGGDQTERPSSQANNEEKNSSTNTNETKKKPSTDTNLTIDSDHLADNKQIRITKQNSKYELSFTAR